MMHIVWSLECHFLACGRNSRVLVAAGHPIPCRKFVKKSILEDPARGLLLNDTIIIRYQIELVVSTGGALARQITNERPSKSVVVPPPNLGAHMLRLFEDRLHTDVVFEVESNQLAAHKIILSARSPVFKALLTGPMLEGASFISSSSLLSKRAYTNGPSTRSLDPHCHAISTINHRPARYGGD